VCKSKKLESSQINNLMRNFKFLQKQEKANAKMDIKSFKNQSRIEELYTKRTV
jgi:hypothetical protein